MVAGVPPTILGVTPNPDFAVADVGATPGMSVAAGAGSDDGNGEGVGVGDGTGAGEVAVGEGIGVVAEAKGSRASAFAPAGMLTNPATRTLDNRPLSSPKSRLLRHIEYPPER